MALSDQIQPPGNVKGVGTPGATGAAGAAGVVPNAATATLSTTHYSAALAARPNPLTDGYAWMQVFAATNPAASDIALSSGTAQPLYSNGAALPAGAIVAGCPYLCRSNGTQVEVLGVVPSTLGPTTIKDANATTQFYVNENGAIAITLRVFGNIYMADDSRLYLGSAITPASATATGTAGNLTWDANYIYVCTATDTWKRVAIATW